MDEKFDKYLELLIKWNAKYNLTAIDDVNEVKTHHFEDSLTPLPYLEDAGSLLDLGAGAGFPGIPIKIEKPELKVVLLDAKRKKVSFCSEVIRELGLKNVEAVQGRAEDRGTVEKLGKFDAVISRATWSLSEYLRIARPYINDKGTCIAMRGADWKRDIEEAKAVIEDEEFRLKDTHRYTVGNSGERCVVVFYKD